MSVIYPSLAVPAGSEFEINTAGPNSSGQPALVDGRTGTPFTNANSTAYVTIADKTGATVLAQTPLAWTAAEGALPARFALVVGAGVCLTGAGNWEAIVQVFGPGGTSDTELRTFYRTLIERD